MSLPKLEICGITVAFQGDVVLNNLSFEVRDGEFLSVLGPSGCGKTTLLRAIAGLTGLQAGSIRKDGEDITNLSPDRRGIGIVFQNYALFENMTALDNAAYALRFHGKSRGEAESMARETLSRVGLSGEMGKYPSELSGGQQQRVAIARTLVLHPDVILFDEPMAALDAETRLVLQDEILRIRNEFAVTMIYVTHDQEEALSMSDKVIVMDGGEIQHIGTPEDIYNEPANAFVADFIGESNILDGVMLSDCRVRFSGHDFDCVDKGFAQNEPVDVVIRPEDVDICAPGDGMLTGVITSVTFKGLHYEIIVDINDFKWMIQTTDYSAEGETIGILIKPDEIHIMKKSKYSGEFGDYSSFSDEMDYISNAELDITDLDDITEVDEDE